MKTCLNLFQCIFLFSIFSFSLSAQENSKAPQNFNQHPLFAYGEKILTVTDTVPDYANAEQKLQISGTVYKSDGITPAKDVVVFIYQTDENGEYELKTDATDERYIYHRAWIKTDEDGNYNFFTFVPGTDFGSNKMKHIHAFVKENNLPVYETDGFLFEDDPYLSRYCRKKLKKAGATHILNPKKIGNILVANHNIVLSHNTQASR